MSVNNYILANIIRDFLDDKPHIVCDILRILSTVPCQFFCHFNALLCLKPSSSTATTIVRNTNHVDLVILCEILSPWICKES